MKPGLGARRCVRCGKKIEGEQSRLLTACPFCALPFGGSAPPFSPSPPTYRPSNPSQAPYAPHPSGGYGAYQGSFPPPVPARSSGGGVVWIVVVVVLLAVTGGAAAAFVLLRSPRETKSVPVTATPIGPEVAVEAKLDAAVGEAKSLARPKPAPTAQNTARPTTTATPPSDPDLNPDPDPTDLTPPPPPPRRTTGFCTASLTIANRLPSTRTCSFNSSVAQGSISSMTFPCSGGSATALFGSQVFRGSVSGDGFTLTNTSPFNFRGAGEATDCNVESSERIVGTFSGGGGSYSYSERVLGGACGNVSTCTATARVNTVVRP